MEEEQNEPEFVHDDEDSTATCDLCGTPVEGRLSCCSDCIDQRMDFLQQAYDAGRTANSNQPRELVSFLQSLFDEITDKMRSPTWSASEAMPEEVRFLDGDDQYTATLGVLDGPTDDDDAFLCIVCGESLLIDQVYTSDVTSDFRLHAKCALEVCVSMSDASSQSHKEREQLAIFLFAIRRDETNRDMQEEFQHSDETISRHFRNVLKAICSLSDEFIVLLGEDVGVHLRVGDSRRFYPYFANALGAVDGTHIPVHVPKSKAVPYRNRKGFLS